MAFLLYSYSFLIMGHPCHHVRPNFPHLSKTRLSGRLFRGLGKSMAAGRELGGASDRAGYEGCRTAPTPAWPLDEAKVAFRAAGEPASRRSGRGMLNLNVSGHAPKADWSNLLTAEVLDPPLCRIYERSAVGPLPPTAAPPPSLGVFARRASKIFDWWMRGLARPTPFFDDRTNAPCSVPCVLTRSERATL